MRNIQNIPPASLPQVLVDYFPELAPFMAQELAFWGEYGRSSIGPDTAFSLVLAPFVIERLKETEGVKDGLLRRIFDFLEELTHSKNNEVLSAVDVSFGEELLADAQAFRRAEEYMGPRLRATFELIQSRRDSLPPRGAFH